MKKLISLSVFLVLLMACQPALEKNYTLKEAEAIALKEVSGEVVSSHEEKDDGKTYYEFVIENDHERYEIEVDAHEGKIIKKEKDDDYVAPNQNETGVDGIITAEKAQEIAMGKVNKGNVVKCELDNDNGNRKYEIEIREGRYEYDLEIDAVSGEILSYNEDYED